MEDSEEGFLLKCGKNIFFLAINIVMVFMREKTNKKQWTFWKYGDEILRKSNNLKKFFKNGSPIFFVVNLAFNSSPINKTGDISSQTREARGQKSMDTKYSPLERACSPGWVVYKEELLFSHPFQPNMEESFTSHSQQKKMKLYTHTQDTYFKILSSAGTKILSDIQ